jgi:hypothetical protein
MNNWEHNDMKTVMTEPFSRRMLLRSGVALMAAAGAATASAAESIAPRKFAQAAQKVAQKDVQYQDSPKDGNKCSLCVNFQPPHACAVVDGTISPDGWCVAFAPKAG